MSNSTRNILTVLGPLDAADRFVGRIVRGGLEGFIPIPPAATPAHTYMGIWAARLGDAADLAAVVAEDALTDQPTPEQIQEALEAPAPGQIQEAIEAQAEADAEEATGEQIQDNGVRIGSLLPYATYDDYLEAAERANTCPLSEYSFREAKADTASGFATYKDYLTWAAELNAKCKCGEHETISPISEEFFRESKELAIELKDRDAFEEAMMSIGITIGDSDAYMKWCKAKKVYQYDLETFHRWRESMDELTNEHIQEARAVQQDDDDDWVTVETGSGYTYQITFTQYEEDLAAGILVDVGGYLIYKCDIHRATAEESDYEYVSRLEANIRRVEAEIAAERKARAARTSVADDDIDYFADLATRWD
jgi:hypothetical protein